MRKYRFKNSDEIIFHPMIVPAVSFVQSFEPLVDNVVLQSMASNFLDGEYLHAIQLSSDKNSKNKIALITSVPLIARFGYSITEHIKNGYLYAEQDITGEDIERWAWKSALLSIMQSPDQTSILDFLHKQLKNVPKYILEEFFGRQRISQKFLADLTCHSVDTVKSQGKAKKKSNFLFDGFDGFPSGDFL